MLVKTNISPQTYFLSTSRKVFSNIHFNFCSNFSPTYFFSPTSFFQHTFFHILSAYYILHIYIIEKLTDLIVLNSKVLTERQPDYKILLLIWNIGQYTNIYMKGTSRLYGIHSIVRHSSVLPRNLFDAHGFKLTQKSGKNTNQVAHRISIGLTLSLTLGYCKIFIKSF